MRSAVVLRSFRAAAVWAARLALKSSSIREDSHLSRRSKLLVLRSYCYQPQRIGEPLGYTLRPVLKLFPVHSNRPSGWRNRPAASVFHFTLYFRLGDGVALYLCLFTEIYA